MTNFSDLVPLQSGPMSINTLVLLKITICSLFVVTNAAAEPDADCVAWFSRAKIKTGTRDCELSCATLMVDMGTFICPNQCEELCSTRPAGPLIAKFIFYPGLTPTEKNLAAKNAKDAFTVYKQKNIAEKSTSRYFPDQNLNDESDAFRHFLWAALLTKELSKVRAKEFLDAHEADPDQPDIERQMDMHNNSRGQAAAESLLKEKRWSQKNIEAQGLEELRAHRLQVLKPGLPIPKEPR
jgi:hypothetical protein